MQTFILRTRVIARGVAYVLLGSGANLVRERDVRLGEHNALYSRIRHH
jgi:DNA transposition AAA+ family ATPase